MQVKTAIIQKIGLPDVIEPDILNKAMAGVEAVSVDISPWHEQYPSDARASVRMAHDGKKICFLFDCVTDGIRNVNTADQSPVSDDSCVEVFLEPRVGERYCNLEVNFGGAVNSSRRFGRHDSIRLDVGELTDIERFHNNYEDSMVDKAKSHWQQCICVPMSLVGIDYHPGVALRGNLYACSSASKQQYYLCWSPIDTPAPDYHRPEFFGNLILQ